METYHHPSAIWSVTMKPIETQRKLSSPLIVVRLSFCHWHELHHHCHDPNSPNLHDHIALTKDHVECSFRGTLVFPLELETLCFRMAFADGIGEEKGFILPEFVTAGAWNYLKDKVLCFLLENVDFDDNQGLGFEMLAHLQISTVVAVDDDHLDESCSDYGEDSRMFLQLGLD